MAEVLRCDQCGQIAERPDYTPRWWQLQATGHYRAMGSPQASAPYHFCSTACLAAWAAARREPAETGDLSATPPA